MAAIGRHTTADFYGCRREALNNMDLLQDMLSTAIHAADLKMLSIQSYQFSPEGITVVALLTDGHLAIHTYPEVGFAALGEDLRHRASFPPLDLLVQIHVSPAETAS